MNLGLIILFIGILCLIGLIATIMVIKQEENKMKKYAEADTPEDELKRSIEYESKSLSSNVKSLTWIYVVFIAISFIGLAIYIYMQ